MSHPGTSASAIANPAGRRIGRTCRKNNRNYLDAPNLTSTSSLCVAIATSLRPRSAADHVGPDAPNRRLRRTAPERTISTATSNPASAQNDRIRRARSAAPAPVRLSTSAPRQTQVAALHETQLPAERMQAIKTWASPWRSGVAAVARSEWNVGIFRRRWRRFGCIRSSSDLIGEAGELGWRCTPEAP
jgi:hypothetical protein